METALWIIGVVLAVHIFVCFVAFFDSDDGIFAQLRRLRKDAEILSRLKASVDWVEKLYLDNMTTDKKINLLLEHLNLKYIPGEYKATTSLPRLGSTIQPNITCGTISGVTLESRPYPDPFGVEIKPLKVTTKGDAWSRSVTSENDTYSLTPKGKAALKNKKKGK